VFSIEYDIHRMVPYRMGFQWNLFPISYVLCRMGSLYMVFTSHEREGRGAREGTRAIARAGNMSHGTCMREDGARGSWPHDQLLLMWGAWNLGGLFVYYFLWFFEVCC
jgi:hypothetical protein